MEREKQRDRTLDLLDGWVGVGVCGRAVVILAIIAGLGWLIFQVLNLAVTLAFVLAR